MKSFALLAAAFISCLSWTAPASADDSTLAKIKQSRTIKLGYREQSIPFSYVGDDRQARGYSIDLCRRVVDAVAAHLQLAKLDVRWVPVSAQSRFEALKRGDIDLECGNTTQTLSRRADFDFSLMTYVDGAGLLFRENERPASLNEIKDQGVAVVTGTTTEKTLDDLVRSGKLGVRVLKVADHDAAIKALSNKAAIAYAADRTILISSALLRGQGKGFELATVQFTYEPYGLMMRRDADFRLLVDRVLAGLYRSGEIGSIMQTWFGSLGDPGESLRAMVLLNGLPE